MAKRNRERAKQAKRKAKEERRAQRAADKLQRLPEDLDEFGNPVELADDLDESAEQETPENEPSQAS